MKPSHLAFLVLALSLVSLSQLGCGGDAQSKTPEEAEKEAVVPVEAASVQTGSIDAVFIGTASLEAEEDASVVARAGGVVKTILVEEGDYVRSGEPLVQLDEERLAIDLRRAEVTLEKLKLEMDRKGELHSKKLISDEEYQRVKSDHDLQVQVRDMAALELEYTTVRAPISGVISQRHVKVGNMVQRNDAVFHITDFDPLLAVMNVPERELHKLESGQRAAVLVDAVPDGRFDGFIKRISPVVDAQSGTFEVTIEVRDRSRRLKPGMFGRVLVTHDTHTNTLLVPKSAVIREDAEASVYVVRDSVAYKKPVVLGYENEQAIEIVSGIEPGDLVVVTGQAGLRDSSRVEAVNP